MSKYVDYKCTIWGRLHYEGDADLNKIQEKLNQGYLPAELADEELGFREFEMLYDTEEYLSPDENDGQPTIKVYEEKEFKKMIWNNNNK